MRALKSHSKVEVLLKLQVGYWSAIAKIIRGAFLFMLVGMWVN